MPFKRSILRISELVADAITGAVYQTGKTAPFVRLRQVGVNGLLEFVAGDQGGAQPETASAAMRNQAAIVGQAPQLFCQSSATRDFPQQASWSMFSTAGGDGFGQMNVTADLLVQGSTKLGAGTAVKGLDFGMVSFTTDASGIAVVSHNLGQAPVGVFVTNHSALRLAFRVTAETNNTFTMEVWNLATGAVAASITRTISYLAVA